MKSARLAGAVAGTLLAFLIPGSVLPAHAGTADGTGHGLVVRTDRGRVQGKAAEGTAPGWTTRTACT